MAVFNLLLDLQMTKGREVWKDGRTEEREMCSLHYGRLHPITYYVPWWNKSKAFINWFLSVRFVFITLGDLDCQSDDTVETKEQQYDDASSRQCIQVLLHHYSSVFRSHCIITEVYSGLTSLSRQCIQVSLQLLISTWDWLSGRQCTRLSMPCPKGGYAICFPL